MGKHLDKVGKYEDFRAPWETESGGDAEIDKSKLKRYIFNLKSGEATALDAVDDSKEAVKAAETERDEAKQEAAKASPDEANKKIAKLEKENSELKAAADEREKADEHAKLRKEVLGDLPEKYAKYVVGADKKELEESLEQVKADFNLGDENEEEEDDDVLSSRPKSRLNNVTDPQGGAGAPKEIDFDAVAEGIIGGGRAFG